MTPTFASRNGGWRTTSSSCSSGSSPFLSCSSSSSSAPPNPGASCNEGARMNVRDYTYLGTTRSLCPHCRRVVDAKIVLRDKRVYFRKRCPEHGTYEDFVCSDVAYFDRHDH